MRKILGPQVHAKVVVFLRKSFYPLETWLMSCFYNGDCPYRSGSNTNIEGTNNATKHSDLGLNRTMKSAVATKRLSDQTEERTLDLQLAASADYYNTHITETAPSGVLNRVADSMVLDNQRRSHEYVSYRYDERKWVVFHSSIKAIEDKRGCFIVEEWLGFESLIAQMNDFIKSNINEATAGDPYRELGKHWYWEYDGMGGAKPMLYKNRQ